MSVITALNTKIVEKYHITISSTVEVYQDFFDSPPGQLIRSYENPDKEYKSYPDSIYDDLYDAIKDYIEDFIAIEVDTALLRYVLTEEDSDFDEGFWISVQTNKNGDVPSNEEVDLWADDDEKLYIEEALITVKINGVIIPTDLIYRIVC